MAIIDRARFKPDMNRSTLEAVIGGLRPDTTPPSGMVYLPVQIVTWQDTDLPVASYRPGDPATEQHITTVIEDVLSMSLQGFNGMTAAQVDTDLAARLDAWATTVAPAVALARRVIRAAKRTAPRVIVG
jgi:hypothetical protein